MYDDGGLSGGTMERPALKRLLEDIEASKVQIVVVYKVDRLTRSLSDFASGAFADMNNKAAIDVAKALARLSELTIFELRGEWRRLHRMPPPMRLSRDLLIRGIIYKLQERAYGGLSMATARKLEQAAAGPPSRGAAKPTPPIALKPGTRLVREWRGV
jgi:hypothetical protein